jgi:RNA polymerase sigma-70 factor, ECF subfamily
MHGDDAFLDFYERTADQVYRYASRLTGGDRARTEDLVQDTYLTLVRQIRNGRTEPVEIGWALVTCRSRFLDDVRRETKQATVASRAGHLAATTASPPGTISDATAALAAVPHDQRIALVLRYVDDLPTSDVARTIGRSVRAVESLLARGRQSLRTAYQQQLAVENG